MEPVDLYDHGDRPLCYVPSSIPGRDCPDVYYEDLTRGCEHCTDCSSSKQCPCLVGPTPNYDSEGKLFNNSYPVFECGSRCQCDPEACRNRLVQRGPIQGLYVQESGAGKGLGLFTSRSLPIGRFVCTYSGELLSLKEGQERTGQQDESDSSNYILFVNEKFGSETVATTTIVDPTVMGNIGRYCNHSCAPNLDLVPVRVDSMMPEVALFTREPVQPQEELTFSYGSTVDSVSDGPRGPKKCFCGQTTCRGFLPFQMNVTTKED